MAEVKEQNDEENEKEDKSVTPKKKRMLRELQVGRGKQREVVHVTYTLHNVSIDELETQATKGKDKSIQNGSAYQ